MPAQDGLRRDHQTQGSTPLPRDDVQQERDEGPVSPAHLPARADLALQHDELVS
jgi:hypothetical protein